MKKERKNIDVKCKFSWLKERFMKCKTASRKNEEEDNFNKIDDKEYLSLFGINNPENECLHKAAFKKAWEIRNFEIEKFWQRSAFFWGFIVLIFGGYIKVATENSNETMKGIMYLDFYLILLGIIFSVGWLLVIHGSKRWQENWEEHIFYLEDKFTGPLYKTVYYKGKCKKYYSVSKINEILAWVVIVTWIILLIKYFYNKCSILTNLFDSICNSFKEIFFMGLPALLTVCCIVSMLKCGQSFKGKLNKKLKKDEHGAFFDIGKKN
jgi:hypothetical protein